jgi:hypothetical protein
VSDAPAPASSGPAVKVEGEAPNATKVEVGAEDSNSRAENSRKRAIADVIDISDDEGSEVDGLTAEERAQYARLEARHDNVSPGFVADQSCQAKRRAAASGKEKRGSLTKKPKSEPSDRHFNKEVIDLSD